MNSRKIIEDRERLEKLAPVAKAPIKHHVFVCNGKSCAAAGSADVKAAFERIGSPESAVRQRIEGPKPQRHNPVD